IGAFTIQNSYLDNVTNIDVPVLFSTNGGGGLSGRTTIIRNVQFGNPTNWTNLPCTNVYMDYSHDQDLNYYNLTAQDQVFLYGYRDSGSNYQVFYPENHSEGGTLLDGIYGYVVPI